MESVEDRFQRLGIGSEYGVRKKAGPAVPPKPKKQSFESNIYENDSAVYDYDHSNIYSNIPIYNNINDFAFNRTISPPIPSPPTPPPPTPPPLPSSVFGKSLTLNCGDYANDVPDEFPPPPSPVSSSYSELRRATQPAPDFNPYSIGSRTSLANESIYEPISLRSPSRMSNYSIYSNPNRSGDGISVIGGSTDITSASKEDEVDVLTHRLVKELSGSTSSEEAEDSFGVCVKCGEKIVGEMTGCVAMERNYHIECFTCYQCGDRLQGKPFYALNGKPYCTDDYLNTLEKCSVCSKPILDRILRATGKPYHPHCFCCVVCGQSLDGVTFTVDAVNQIYCIKDFHKKFAPRCSVCRLPIMPEPGQEETIRVVALDRSFHVNCYKCEDCGLVLSSEADGRGCYPLDDHVLCKNCNAKRIQLLTSHIPISTDL